MQYTIGKILENQVALNFNGTSQHLICAGNVKLLDTDERSMKKDAETSFVVGYVVRKMIVSSKRMPNSNKTSNYWQIKQKKKIKIYQNFRHLFTAGKKLFPFTGKVRRI